MEQRRTQWTVITTPRSAINAAGSGPGEQRVSGGSSGSAGRATHLKNARQDAAAVLGREQGLDASTGAPGGALGTREDAATARGAKRAAGLRRTTRSAGSGTKVDTGLCRDFAAAAAHRSRTPRHTGAGHQCRAASI